MRARVGDRTGRYPDPITGLPRDMVALLRKLEARNPAILLEFRADIHRWRRGENLAEGRQLLADAIRDIDE